jgi:hypothetical protein
MYFGYGTYLDDSELHYYLPGAQKITTARASNHKLLFYAHQGFSNRGYCHLSDKLEAFEETAYGIVVKHDPKYFVDYEGFERFFLTVYGCDGHIYDCWSLRMTNPGIPVRPPVYYWNHIKNGLLYYDFPNDYTKKVLEVYEKSLPCPEADMPDPKETH